MELPRRYIEFGLLVGADSMNDLADALRELARDIDCGVSPCCYTGGSRYGYQARTATRANEGITHESYFAELDRWIEAENKARGEA
jgi:hypothetical protein